MKDVLSKLEPRKNKEAESRLLLISIRSFSPQQLKIVKFRNFKTNRGSQISIKPP